MMVAQEILNQLGGGRFVVMTGARDFIGGDYDLLMTLPRNKSKANRLRITLTAMDDYTLEFYRQTGGTWDSKNFTMRPVKREAVKTLEGIYCDQLQEIFTAVTGLYTHF